MAPTRLWNRSFYLLWQAQFVSVLGVQASAIATLYWFLEQTRSAALLGLLMTVVTLPAVVLGPIGGTLADRVSRRPLLIGCELAQGAALLALAALVLAPGLSGPQRVVGIFVVSMVSSSIAAFFRPAVNAALPDLVPPAQIAAGNSLMQMSQQVATLVGMLFGGVLFRLLGAGLLYLLDSLTYFFAAASQVFLKLPERRPAPSGSRREALAAFWRETRAGLDYVRGNRGLKALFFACCFLNFFIAPVSLLLPFYVDKTLQATPDWFGFLVAALTAGSLVGSLAAGSLPWWGGRRAIAVLSALALLALGLAALGLTGHKIVALALMAVVGLAAGFVNVNLVTLLQLSTDPGLLGRLFGLLGTLTQGLIPLSMALTGGLLESLNQAASPFLIGCGLAALLSTALVAASAEFRRLLSLVPQPPSAQP